jgi:hypothetical protein
LAKFKATPVLWSTINCIKHLLLFVYEDDGGHSLALVFFLTCQNDNLLYKLVMNGTFISNIGLVVLYRFIPKGFLSHSGF